jgi:hypothetical protein
MSLFENRLTIKQHIELVQRKRPALVQHADISITKWCNQFLTTEDQHIALRLLFDFIYYDTKKARNAFKELHLKLMSKLRLKIHQKESEVIFLFPGHAKSGAYMSYLYSQANNIKVKGALHSEMISGKIAERFYPLDSLKDYHFIEKIESFGVNNLVLIDDIVVNGGGLSYYLTDEIRRGFALFDKVFLVTLVASQLGLDRLKFGWKDRLKPPLLDPIPNLEAIYHKEIWNFDDPKNVAYSKEEKVVLNNWLSKYMKIIDSSNYKKFDRSKALVTFNWNTPGTTPMPFCHSRGTWIALFQRYSGPRGDL